jgi:hypothetical protein
MQRDQSTCLTSTHVSCQSGPVIAAAQHCLRIQQGDMDGFGPNTRELTPLSGCRAVQAAKQGAMDITPILMVVLSFSSDTVCLALSSPSVEGFAGDLHVHYYLHVVMSCSIINSISVSCRSTAIQFKKAAPALCTRSRALGTRRQGRWASHTCALIQDVPGSTSMATVTSRCCFLAFRFVYQMHGVACSGSKHVSRTYDALAPCYSKIRR